MQRDTHDGRLSRADSSLLLVTGTVAVVCAAWFLAALVLPAGPVAVSLLVAPLSAAASAVMAVRTAADRSLEPAARTFWRWAAWAMTVLSVSFVSRFADALNPDLSLTPRIGVLTAIGHTVGVALLVVPVYRLSAGAQTLTQRAFLWLDTGAVALGVSAFVWHFMMRPMLAESVQVAPAAGVGAALVLCGVTSVFVIAKVAFTGASGLGRRSLVLFGSALAVGGLGPSIPPLLTGGALLDTSLLVIPMSTFLISLSAYLERAGTGTEERAPSGQRRFSLLPYVAIAATDLLLLVTLPASPVRDRVVVGVLAVILTAVVVFRQIAALRENDQLLGRLNEGLTELSDHEQRFRILVQNSYDVVTISQADGTIMYMSGGSQRMFGRTPNQRAGRNMLDLIHPEDKEAVRSYFAEVAATPNHTLLFQSRFQHADGSWRWIEVLSTNLLDEPSINGIMSNTRDVTEARELQEQLGYEATHDVLTGLANRALFSDRVSLALQAGGAGSNLNIVLIDLDNFKTVNDMLGHSVGDALLVTIAERMRIAVRPGDTVARLGGDEFAILLEGIVEGEVDRVIQRIITSLGEPVHVEGHALSAQASFGIASGHDGDDAGDLLRHADIAMYEAKAKGDGGWTHYRPGMEARGAEENRQAAELRGAIDSGQLRLLYQPVVTLPHGRLTGVEALVRWEHPERGTINPADFIPLAEQTGLIVPLGRWVVREACRQMANWRAEFLERAPRNISVNVSARQLTDASFAEDVMEALLSTGLEAHRLTIEITESTALGGGTTHDTLRRLRDLGVRVALDDFGTGQSTLSLLASCPVDQIKLDRSFMPMPGPDVIATAVVELGRVLGLHVVAEGVETAEQAELLKSLGYAHAQGFHFARPMSPHDVGRALAGSELLADGLSAPGLVARTS